MEDTGRPKVLCVDDEPNVLAGLSTLLRRRYEVLTASNSLGALHLLHHTEALAVVISDMRMPGVDGARFLSQARVAAPDAVRMLLTGQSDIDAAIAAVNDGQVFRFLTKPCPHTVFLPAVAAAVEQHRLITAERVLLEQTLHGSVTALTDVLALASPISSGRANRVRRHVADLAATLEVQDRWQVEVAAMLSQLAGIVLPSELLQKVHEGRVLTEEEATMAGRLPVVTEALLGRIPRLEIVREMLATYAHPYVRLNPDQTDPQRAITQRGAQMLKVAVEFDILELQGHTPPAALKIMRGRARCYDPVVLDALESIRGGHDRPDDVRDVAIAALKVGMVLAADVKLVTGTLVVGRGYEVTASFLERIRNYRPGAVAEPLRVLAPGAIAA